jgi:hypothetical protein
MKDLAFAEAKAAMDQPASRQVRHPFDPTESD